MKLIDSHHDFSLPVADYPHIISSFGLNESLAIRRSKDSKFLTPRLSLGLTETENVRVNPLIDALTIQCPLR